MKSSRTPVDLQACQEALDDHAVTLSPAGYAVLRAALLQAYQLGKQTQPSDAEPPVATAAAAD